MKKLLLVATIFALSSPSFAGERAAMAESIAPYSINREGSLLSARQNTLTEVRTGDLLATGEKPVRMETLAGDTVLLGQESRARFVTENHVDLMEGSLAVSTMGSSPFTASYDDLAFEPFELSSQKSARHMLLVQIESADHVTAQSLSESFTVRNTTTGEQLAVMGSGDDLTFKRIGETWIVQASKVGQPGNESTVQGDGNVAQDEVAQNDDDRRKAGYWIVGGVLGAGAVGGLAYYLYHDDQDDEWNNRRPSSPILP